MTDKTTDNTLAFSDAVYNATAKPHAIDQADVNAGSFCEQAVTYTCFDKVKTVNQGNNTLEYTYGYDRQRIFLYEFVNNTERLKRYVGNCEFVFPPVEDVTAVKALTYLSGPMGVFAVVEKQGDEETLHYILKDHQGSWTVITDAEGNVEQELSYDAWGNLRNPNTWCVDKTIRPMFDRGYTGHEHLNAFGLINMNGRMYDPVMSSFLSVDRYVHQPDNSQGFNRYAYCMYNPLRYVDPSGWLMSRPKGSGTMPPPDGDEFDNYVPGVYVSTGFSSEFDAYTYNYSMYEVTITGSSYSWAEQRCRDYIWNGQEQYSPENSGGLIIMASGYDHGGVAGGCGGYNININNNRANNINIGIQSFNTSNGLKTEIIDAAVRYNYKTNRTWLQWNTKLRDSQRVWRRVNTLGKEGAAYLKFSKALGVAGAFVSVGITTTQIVDYAVEGGRDPNVYAKSTLDVVMVGVGFLGPVGFGISAVYFIVDLSTDGFYGWGAIPDNYKESKP